MERRAFVGTLAGGLLAARLAAEAQQAGKVHEIVIAPSLPPPDQSEDLSLWYLRQVQARISSYWHRPSLRQPVIVLFTIERNGQLSDVRIEATSGDSMHDDRAVQAIRSAGPFPALPDVYPRAAVIRLELK